MSKSLEELEAEIIGAIEAANQAQREANQAQWKADKADAAVKAAFDVFNAAYNEALKGSAK